MAGSLYYVYQAIAESDVHEPPTDTALTIDMTAFTLVSQAYPTSNSPSQRGWRVCQRTLFCEDRINTGAKKPDMRHPRA
jgi:hypothetical protein